MISLLLLAALAVSDHAATKHGKLPADVEQALRAPDKIILYSLEPWERPAAGDTALHEVKVLGQTELDRKRGAIAIAEFKSAISRWESNSACFEPRHALRVTAKGHTYDLLLCYACSQAAVYRDDQFLIARAATGSGKVLNKLLTASGVPLTKLYSEEKVGAQEKEYDRARKRWREAMPKSLRPFWEDMLRMRLDPDVAPLRAALARELPDPHRRILALFAWISSGVDSPSRNIPPLYQQVPEILLLGVPTSEDLIAAAETGNLTEPQLEGAARFFSGWAFEKERPANRKALPAALKKKLLDQMLKSTDDNRLRQARGAFGQ